MEPRPCAHIPWICNCEHEAALAVLQAEIDRLRKVNTELRERLSQALEKLSAERRLNAPPKDPR